MGAIANGIMKYAQPLIDETDGSIEQLNKRRALAKPAGASPSCLRKIASPQ